MESAMTALISARTWQQLLTDESGQDILEYALLASFLGFSAVAGMNVLSAAMKNAYTAWDTAAQSDALVEVQDPKPK